MSHQSGYVAILGKPNAGKSTLLNQLLGTRLAITTPKAQTTRHQIAGIYSNEEMQIIFLDTPGIITPTYSLQEAMMQTVRRAKADSDLVLFVFDPRDPHPSDQVIDLLHSFHKPILLIVNKSDQYSPDDPVIQHAVEGVQKRLKIAETIYLSALTGDQVPELLEQIQKRIPEGPAYFPKDELSEHPMRFFASELIREQIFMQTHEEIPYSCTVEVSQYEEAPEIDRIYAEIIVNRESQKGILIGKGGVTIKSIGIKSRESIQEFTGKQVYLDLRVKVREKWREQENWVKRLGY